MKNEEIFFKLTGLDNISSKVLAIVISNPKLTVNQISSEIKINEKKLDEIIKKLISKKIIEISEEKTVRIKPEFALKSAGFLEESITEFSDKLRSARFLSLDRFVEEIKEIFEGKGFKIQKTEIREKATFGFENELLKIEIQYKFTAEKFYRFGIFIFDQELWKKLQHRQKGLFEYFRSIVYDLERRAKSLGTFVFFDPRLNESDILRIKKYLLMSRRRYHVRSSSEEFFFIQEPELTIRDFLENKLNEIDIRWENVNFSFTELKKQLKETREIIIEDSMMISQLNSLSSGQYMPNRNQSEQITKFMIPIKSVVDRESRNLEIFERKYEEEKQEMERLMDSFDKRLILPNPTIIKEKTQEISRLKSKFEPIRHELKSLLDMLLMPYIRGQEPMKINPFLLTEPNNIEKFTINQLNIKNSSVNFYKKLKKGGSNILFIVGAAGTGKTHALRHVFYTQAKNNNFWPIYIDCPMKYDIVSSLFLEIVQERNFPEKLHNLLPSIRKQKVSTPFEFINVLKKLNEIVVTNGYNGLIILIDELENSLPYTYDIQYQKNINNMEESPLALRQLNEILSSDRINEIGFIFGFRDHILSEVKNGLKLKDFNRFIVQPEILTIKNFKELIEIRCKTWNTKPITFRQTVIKEVMTTTNSNTRHMIQYFRALYYQALSHNSKTITNKTLESIGRLPLFSY
jgi:hypothetical protein